MTSKNINHRWDCVMVLRACHAFLDNEVDADAVLSINTHLASCPGCRSHYDHERSFSDLLQQSLTTSDPPSTNALRSKVKAGLAWARTPDFSSRARMVAAAAVLFVGILIGATTMMIWNSLPGMKQSQSMSARADEFQTIARNVLSLPGTYSNHERALEDLGRNVPGLDMPVATGNDYPKPRLFGSQQLGPHTVHWVIYCTGATAPDYTERFVLITTDHECIEPLMSGLDCLELDKDGLRTLIWRDGKCFRVMITRRESGWARQQRDALVKA